MIYKNCLTHIKTDSIKLLINFIIFSFTFTITFGQENNPDISIGKTAVRFKIKPSETDPTIKSSDFPHLIYYEPEVTQGKILLFLPGTNGIGEKGPINFFKTALEKGYRVISLTYIDTPAVCNICRGKTLFNDRNCAEKFRKKRIFGENTTSVISDKPQDAIVNRLTKLLIYLTENDRKGNWVKYIENGSPKWNLMVVAGQSQGGGMAAFLAKQVLVNRVITFSGPTDRAAKNIVAEWMCTKSVTPPERWFGSYHIEEDDAASLAEGYKALGIQENHIYVFNLKVPKGKKAHGEGIRNIAYKPVWQKMLGSGTEIPD